MARIFYPSSEKLRFLLESIHHREVALPDFQRDFVWDPRARWPERRRSTDIRLHTSCSTVSSVSLRSTRPSTGPGTTATS